MMNSARRAALAERVQQLGERLIEAEAECAVIHRLQRVRPALITWPMSSRTIQRFRLATTSFVSTGLAVVEFQARAQLEGPGLEIGGDLVAFAHLRRGVSCRYRRRTACPRPARRVAHDILRGPDRIEVGEIGLRHEAQHAGIGAASDVRRGQSAAAAAAADRRKARRCMRSSCGFLLPAAPGRIVSRTGCIVSPMSLPCKRSSGWARGRSRDRQYQEREGSRIVAAAARRGGPGSVISVEQLGEHRICRRNGRGVSWTTTVKASAVTWGARRCSMISHRSRLTVRCEPMSQPLPNSICIADVADEVVTIETCGPLRARFADAIRWDRWVNLFLTGKRWPPRCGFTGCATWCSIGR